MHTRVSFMQRKRKGLWVIWDIGIKEQRRQITRWPSLPLCLTMLCAFMIWQSGRKQ